MITLGLDPSLTAFGWSVNDSEASGLARRVASGHEETLPTTVPVARFIHYRSMVKRLLNTFEPHLVGIESPAYDAGVFQTTHHSLMMFCLEAIFESRKDCVLFDPATLKSLVKGNKKNHVGVMTKLDMQRFVQLDTMDPNLIDNNEADAYCISHFAARFRALSDGSLSPTDLTESEFRVFLGKTKKVKTLRGVKVKRIAHIFRENSRYFQFSKVPHGRVDLPKKSDIDGNLIKFLEAVQE